MPSGPSYLYWLIVGCEGAFWIVLVLALVARYLLQRNAVSRVLLVALPALDILLVAFTAIGPSGRDSRHFRPRPGGFCGTADSCLLVQLHGLGHRPDEQAAKKISSGTNSDALASAKRWPLRRHSACVDTAAQSSTALERAAHDRPLPTRYSLQT